MFTRILGYIQQFSIRHCLPPVTCKFRTIWFQSETMEFVINDYSGKSSISAEFLVRAKKLHVGRVLASEMMSAQYNYLFSVKSKYLERLLATQI